MCGISGIIGISSKIVLKEQIVAMTDTLQHRGPDGEGYLLTNAEGLTSGIKEKRPYALVINKSHRQELVLGHRRLSIVDLSDGANQPMCDKSGQYWIVFNGEIYNHVALRKELQNLGCEFSTSHSDTEVILNAYKIWGKDCLDRFNGMWAFCIWDSLENSFFLARDRAGKKPLFYSEHDGLFYFASEINAILSNSAIPRRFNEKGIYDYLTYMMVPAPATLLKDVSKLAAGHYLFIRPGESYKQERYWSPINSHPDWQDSEKIIADELREKLFEAARLRMLADVEVGVLLSGGLDSSINLACLAKYANRPIKAFSVGFENKNGYQNEFSYAKRVAKQFEAEYHELTLTENDFLDFFPDMVRFQGEPIADTANIPIYFIAKEARKKGVKVLLGGEGSDELFVGYELWKLSRQFAEVLEDKTLLTRAARATHRWSPVKNRRLYYYSWYEKVIAGQPVFWSGTELRSEFEKSEILRDSFKERLGKVSSFDSIEKLYQSYQISGSQEKYRWMSAVDLQNRLPDLLLARLDRMLMAASVEGRNPFLDVNVMEYAMRIPAHLKASSGQEKYILKKAFEGILPNDIIYRKKDSFTIPLKQIFGNKEFQNEAAKKIETLNASESIFTNDYIKKVASIHNPAEFWNVANLAFWFDQIKKGQPVGL